MLLFAVLAIALSSTLAQQSNQFTVQPPYFPAGIAVDAAGNLYIADSGNSQIRKVTPDGGTSTVAGTGLPGFSGDGGPATTAQLRNPLAVAVDSAGNLYIADSGNARIRKVTTNGSILTIAGDGKPGFSGDGGPAVSARLNIPSDLVFDRENNLYIADAGGHRVRKVTAAGLIATAAGNGKPGFDGDGGPALSAQLCAPYGVTVDMKGNLYIADSGNDRIRMVSPDGTISTIVGNVLRGFSGDGGPAGLAQLKSPLGVAVDRTGNLYIADTGNARVRKVTSAGTINTVAGTGTPGSEGEGGPASKAQLSTPYRVVLGEGETVYISDVGNQNVRQVTAANLMTTVSAFANASEQKSESASSGEKPQRVGDGVTRPIVVSRVEPKYSETARQARFEGTVVLDAIVRKDGTMEIGRIVRGLGFGLDENAITAMRRWKFKPGLRNGRPVDVSLNIEINFNLR